MAVHKAPKRKVTRPARRAGGAARRTGEVERRTAETRVLASFALDGTGTARVRTGIGFLDHMLAAFARHGRFDLRVDCTGDLEVDAHHSVEDVGLALGAALARALGDKRGVVRFGHAYVPLDEALVRVVVDLSGRPFVHYDVTFHAERVGTLPTELIEDFFRAFADQARLTLHADLVRGRNSHHVAEALFKAAARALATAVSLDPRVHGVPSTKGVL